jgi:hypothetical protein
MACLIVIFSAAWGSIVKHFACTWSFFISSYVRLPINRSFIDESERGSVRQAERRVGSLSIMITGSAFARISDDFEQECPLPFTEEHAVPAGEKTKAKSVSANVS